MKRTTSYILLTLLLAGAGYVLLSRSSGTLKQDVSDFLPAAGAGIDKFTIRRAGESLTIRRSGEGWVLQDGHRVKPEMIQFFFQTLQRFEILSPASKSDHHRLQESLPASGREISFFGQNRLLKSFFIGYDSSGVKGTYIMDKHRNPYRIRLKGFDETDIEGFFSLQAENWQVRTLLGFRADELASVTAIYPRNPGQNFTLTQPVPGAYSLAGARVLPADSEKIGDYLQFFSEISYTRVNKASRFMRPGPPDAGLRCTLRHGESTSFDIYPFYPETGGDLPDKNLAIVVLPATTDTVVVKYSDLDPLLLTLSDFQKK